MHVQDGWSAAKPGIAIPGTRDDDPCDPRRCMTVLIDGDTCICGIPCITDRSCEPIHGNDGVRCARPVLRWRLLSASVMPLP